MLEVHSELTVDRTSYTVIVSESVPSSGDNQPAGNMESEPSTSAVTVTKITAATGSAERKTAVDSGPEDTVEKYRDGEMTPSVKEASMDTAVSTSLVAAKQDRNGERNLSSNKEAKKTTPRPSVSGPFSVTLKEEAKPKALGSVTPVKEQQLDRTQSVKGKAIASKIRVVNKDQGAGTSAKEEAGPSNTSNVTVEKKQHDKPRKGGKMSPNCMSKKGKHKKTGGKCCADQTGSGVSCQKICFSWYEMRMVLSANKDGFDILLATLNLLLISMLDIYNATMKASLCGLAVIWRLKYSTQVTGCKSMGCIKACW